MGESKHTPGPWTVKDHDTYPKAFGVIAGPAFEICWVRYAGDITEENSRQREIDARLIAAAPELLEALKFVSKWFSTREDMDEPFPSQLTNPVRAAISKAEGR